MDNFGIEFGAIALAHALAVASPGPDFALMVRQSLRHGRATAMRTAWGIGSGIVVHVSLAVIGIGVLVRSSPPLFTSLRLSGAAYMLWLAWRSFRSNPMPDIDEAVDNVAVGAQRGAWRRGFLTNVLNPKAALFFVALYSVVVSSTTPLWAQAIYGGWMVVGTATWFSLVAVLFTQPALRRSYLRSSVWVDRAMGLIFVAFAMNLLWFEVNASRH